MKLKLIPITTDSKSMKKYLTNDFFTEIFSIYEKLYPETGFHFPWIGYIALHENEVVGVGGYKSPPKDNKVEIAYGVAPEKEGQGFATEICRQLTNIAINEVPDIRVTARTLMEENASTTILKKNGYKFAGEVEDPEDCQVWEWEFEK